MSSLEEVWVATTQQAIDEEDSKTSSGECETADEYETSESLSTSTCMARQLMEKA